METILELINWFIDFVLHMDKHLPQMVNDMGIWIYLVLFVIIFIETGVVVMPFLPGDSLLFVAGALVSLAGLVGLAFLATYYYLKPTLPDVAVLRDVRLQVPLRVYSRDGRLLAQAAERIRAGAVVAYPTDSCYALGCHLGDKDAMALVFYWGAPGACPPQAAGPLKSECSGLLRPAAHHSSNPSLQPPRFPTPS